MEIRKHISTWGAVALLAFSPLCIAADAAKTTAADVSRKADETAHAVKSYTIQQRDEAVKSAKAALDDIDARLRALDRKVDREWDKMDQAARKKARAAQSALRRERDDAAEWYGALKHSSAESWEEVKGGFVKSYETLKQSFTKAAKGF
jgi:hypothetical protein